VDFLKDSEVLLPEKADSFIPESEYRQKGRKKNAGEGSNHPDAEEIKQGGTA
jgi:hypothetical protein